MANWFSSDKERDFFVYIDPRDWLIRHHVTVVGCFISTPAALSDQTLMFLPNPDFKAAISPFQNNLLRNYMAEYNLELSRQRYSAKYPCRLQAIFLWESESEAEKYRTRHPEHVGNRVLKRVKTAGPYIYSVHDSSWVDFLRIMHSMDEATLESVGQAYWSGDTVNMHPLRSMGKPWSEEPIMEVLFLGRVDFYDRVLPT